MQPAGATPVPGQIVTAVTDDAMLRETFSAMTGDPVLGVVLGAVATLVAHSSVAVVLILVGLAAGHVVTPTAAIALVLGANVGGALPPVIETRSNNPANRRVPVGNLLFRAVGCAVVLPFVHPIADALWGYDPDPRAAITTFHLAFNVALVVAFVGLLGPVRALLTWMFPEKVKPAAEAARPLFLDAGALETPYLALSNAAREILRMGDLIDALLRLVPESLARRDKSSTGQATRLGRQLDTLHEAVKSYLARLDRADLTERDVIRLSDLLEFAVNLGHAGDILERGIAHAATHRDDVPSDADRDAILRIHARVCADVRLALSTMMTEDQRSARELVDAKREINESGRAAVRDHLARLGGTDPAALGASSLFLSMLRDLQRVNSHLASVGYAVLDPDDSNRSHPPFRVTAGSGQDGAWVR